MREYSCARAKNSPRGTNALADTIIFVLTALLVVVCALLVVLNRNPVHSALFLVLTFLGLAVFYLQLDAPFLAAVQVIVYAGAIMVLFVFVVMLISEDKPLQSEEGLTVPPTLGALFAAGFSGGVDLPRRAPTRR